VTKIYFIHHLSSTIFSSIFPFPSFLSFFLAGYLLNNYETRREKKSFTNHTFFASMNQISVNKCIKLHGCTHVSLCVCVCVCMCVCVYVCAYTYIYIHTYMNLCIYMFIYKQIRMCEHFGQHRLKNVKEKEKC